MENFYIILIISVVINLIIAICIAKWSVRVQLDFLRVFLISFLLSPIVGMFYVIINKKELVDLSTEMQSVINSYIRKIGYCLALIAFISLALCIKCSIEDDQFRANQYLEIQEIQKIQNRNDSIILNNADLSKKYPWDTIK